MLSDINTMLRNEEVLEDSAVITSKLLSNQNATRVLGWSELSLPVTFNM
jgi:hypothetical protein